jgi:hypothetical protein
LTNALSTLRYHQGSSICRNQDITFYACTATETHVTKKKGKTTVHKTILMLDDVKLNQNLDFDMFSVRRMEKGL